MKLDISAQKWLNASSDFSLEEYKGKMVIVYAFQMLCPACVVQSIPQANKVHQLIQKDNAKIIGLHSVFENHAGMQEESLKVFLEQFRVRFPVAIDQYVNKNPTPETMLRYNLQGTPSLLVFDDKHQLVMKRFGHVDDLQLGKLLGQVAG